MTNSIRSPIICLLGPTASGKTPLAIELVQQFPCEIISVDSAMVYTGMDIGTAKPTTDILKIAPHRLIDILDPSHAYSAGQFHSDVLREIEAIIAHKKIPLLVGGTMMYFRVLQQGLAKLPPANSVLRAELASKAEQEGWETLHVQLAHVDPEAAKRIHPHDAQRIQRALEVYLLTGKTITAWQVEDTNPLSVHQIHNIAIAPRDRSRLHERIALRLTQMLEMGFVNEVRKLYERGDLNAEMPSIRSVGYRQVWDYLAGSITEAQMREQVLAATRQLAKRQMTWLRTWPDVMWLDSDAHDVFDCAASFLAQIMRNPK